MNAFEKHLGNGKELRVHLQPNDRLLWAAEGATGKGLSRTQGGQVHTEVKFDGKAYTGHRARQVGKIPPAPAMRVRWGWTRQDLEEPPVTVHSKKSTAKAVY